MTAPTPTHPALAGLVTLADDFDTTVGFRGAATALRAAIAEASARLGEVEVREEWMTICEHGASGPYARRTEPRCGLLVRHERREVHVTPWQPVGPSAGGAS